MFLGFSVSVLAIIAGVLVLIALFNVRALKKIFTVISAQFGKLARWITGIDPTALYKEKIDVATQRLRTSKEGLVKVQGLVGRVERQVEDGNREATRLDVRIKAAIAEKNDIKAADYVKQLQQVKEHLKENQHQLELHKETYTEFLNQIKATQSEILNAKAEGERLGSQLEISKAEGELSEISQNLNPGASLEGLGEIKNEMNKQIDMNRAKGKVYSDLNAGQISQYEEDEKIRNEEAKALLEQYKKDSQVGS